MHHSPNKGVSLLRNVLLLFWCCVVIGSGAGHAHDGDDHPIEIQPSTWLQIQRSVFDRKCIGCHSEGTSFARQSGLVLTEDVAYEQLIGIPPKNPAAAADGLVRIATNGPETLDRSFLWLKIDAGNQERFLNEHPDYGTMMPLTDFPLTNGEIELIRQWILAGAPRDGIVADAKVLEDTGTYAPPEFKPLEVPEFGFQIKVGPFRVPANRDREVYLYRSLNNPEPVYVKRIEMTMAPGSHHIVLWANSPGSDPPPEGVIRDLYDPIDGALNESTFPILNGRMLAASQTPNYVYQFPPGYALKFEPNMGLDINSHYARAGAEQWGEAYINLHYARPDEVRNTVEIMWLQYNNLIILPKQERTFTGNYEVTEPTHILQMWSHGHEALLEFWIEISKPDNAGEYELVYYSDDWEHPPLLNFDPPLTLVPGQRIRYRARYYNFTDTIKTFGVTSTDEMMMVFGYWVRGELNETTSVDGWDLHGSDR